jgi:cell shape-determining protein MreC
LRAEVKGLRADLVPRKALRRQWRIAAALVVLGLVVTFAGGVVTRNVTLAAFRRDVVTCFLQPARLTERTAAACARKFAIHDEYREQQAASRARLAEYERLKQRVTRLEDEVHRLKE